MEDNKEQTEVLATCPCGKGANCYKSPSIDFGLCLDCGLSKIGSLVNQEDKKYPQLYKEIQIDDWLPYIRQTDEYIVFLDGESADNTYWVYVELDEKTGKAKDETKIIWKREDFFDMFLFLQKK